MSIWHYTFGLEIGQIFTDRIIRFAMEDLQQRRAVWFSTNPHWETTVWKSLTTYDGRGRERDLDLGFVLLDAIFGCYRIQVSESLPLLTWHEFREKAYPKGNRNWRVLEKMAYERKATPSQWRASFEEVGAEHWVGVEIWREKTWVPFTDDEQKQAIEDTATTPRQERVRRSVDAYNLKHFGIKPPVRSG